MYSNEYPLLFLYLPIKHLRTEEYGQFNILLASSALEKVNSALSLKAFTLLFLYAPLFLPSFAILCLYLVCSLVTAPTLFPPTVVAIL